VRSATVENSATSFALATHNMTVQQYLRMEDEAEYLVKEASQPENAEGEETAQRQKTTDRRNPSLVYGNRLNIRA